ncbi:MAG: hypothetical protein QM651_17265 [Rhodoblastus sp.]
MAPASALACNPIEALFGACRMEIFRPAYTYQQDVYAPRPAARAHATRQARVKAMADKGGVSGKETPLKATADAPIGSLALFREDPTLRNGDVVVTNEGFRIYRNGQFAAIGAKGRLAALEKASMMARVPQNRLQTVADSRR